MDTKKFLIAFVVVYVVNMLLNLVIHGSILESYYTTAPMSDIMRPEEEMQGKMWIHFVTGLFFSFFFVFIFTKGYENKGIMEGARYGLYIGLLMALPAAYDSYAVYPIPYGYAFQWFLYGMIQTIILGVVAALLYKPKAAKPAES